MGKSSSSEASDNEGDEKKLVRRAGINLGIEITDKEKDFRAKLYPDVSKIRKENLKCTVCSRNIVPAIFLKGRLFRHIVLDVLVCEECLQFYGDGDFSTDEDGDDKYCRWCGQGGRLYCCSKCTCVFCKKCVKRNLKRSEVGKLENEDWNCFICRPKPLFPLRAECWAVQEHVQNENRKKAKATSKQETSKRRHSSSDEDMPSKQKKKDQGPALKKSRLRPKQSSDDSNSNDKPKRRKHELQENSGNSDSSDKSEKTDSGAINRSESPKRENSPVRTKRIINHESRDYVSSKKPTVSVCSKNDSSESKLSNDVTVKENDKHVGSVDSSDGSKSKRSVKSSHSRDSSVCSESKKTKKQIKLACDFLLSTIQNIQELGRVMLNRVKIFENIFTPNTLQTQDDVLKAINKLSKMLVVVNKNVCVIQEALDQNMKNWAAVMDVPNALNLSSLIFSKSELKNENERMDTDEIEGSVASANENVKNTVIEGDTLIADESEKPEFPNGVDFEQVIDDVIQTVTKSIENEAGTEIAGTETNATKETVNENGVFIENINESGKAGDTVETEKSEVKSSKETEKKNEADEITDGKNEAAEERIDKDAVETTDDKGNETSVLNSSEDSMHNEKPNESKEAESVFEIEESTTDISSTHLNETLVDGEKETEESIIKGLSEKEITEMLGEENKICEQNVEGEDNIISENSDKKESEESINTLDLHLSEPEIGGNELAEGNSEQVNDKENDKKENSILEDDKAVLAELLNDSSDEEGSVSDDKKQQPVLSSSSSEDLLLSPSSDEDRNGRKKRRKRKQKTDMKKSGRKTESKESEDEEKDDEDEKSDSGENEEEIKNEENKDDTKQDTDLDDEIARLTDLSKINKRKMKVYTSSEEENKSNQDSDDTSDEGKSAVTKKKKHEKSKKQDKEGLLDFLGNSDKEEAKDNDACEDLGDRSVLSDDSFTMRRITDQCKNMEKEQQQLALKLLLLSSDSDVDKVPAEHDSDSDILFNDGSNKKKRKKRKKSEEKSDKKSDDEKGDGEDGSDGNKTDDAKTETKETVENSDIDEGNKEEEDKTHSKSENEENENGKVSDNSADTSSSSLDLFQTKKKKSKKSWRKDRALTMKLSQSDTSDEERWWFKRLQKQKEKRAKKAKNKIISDSDKSEKSDKSEQSEKSDSLFSIKLSTSEDSSSWESEIIKTKKTKRKKANSDTSASKASSASSIKKKKEKKKNQVSSA